MAYPLKDYQVSFSDDYERICIVTRTVPPVVEAEVGLRDCPAHLVVDLTDDLVEIFSGDELAKPFEQVLVDTTQDAYFGLDSLAMGGIGISDLRDNYREIHFFDLTQCALTFQLIDVLNTKTMVMTGKGNSDAGDFYRKLSRKTIHLPI